MKPTLRIRSLRGVSLVEALVALAVMAFGMLGVVGMQTSLRSNADLSRQRAEAVRLAQEEVERWRNYSVLLSADATTGQLAFEDISGLAEPSLTTSDTNTVFSRQSFVATPTADDPLIRHVRVLVSWEDRKAQAQTVELSTMIAGVPPELSALHAMRTDRSALQQPLGRNAAVPRGAVDLADGSNTSRFVPPGGPTTRSWIFDNASGLITKICEPAGTCTATNRWLLSGIVAFATGGAPSSGEAASPGDAAFDIIIRVSLSLPTPASIEPCVVERTATRVNYHCALPLSVTLRWAGVVQFSGFSKATSISDATATRFRVCRYTPDDRNLTAIPSGESAGYYNSRHPYTYRSVDGPQLNKNFLIISAGNGTTAYSCPDEDTATLIETNTFRHDPIS